MRAMRGAARPTSEVASDLVRISAASLEGTLPEAARNSVPPLLFNKAAQLSLHAAKKIPTISNAAAVLVVELSDFPSGRGDALQGPGGAAIVLLQDQAGAFLLHGVEVRVLDEVALVLESQQRSAPLANSTSVQSPPRKMPTTGRKRMLAQWARSLAHALVSAGAVEKSPGEGGLGIAAVALKMGGVYAEAVVPAGQTPAELAAELAESVEVVSREIEALQLDVRASRVRAPPSRAAARAEAEDGSAASFVSLSASAGRGATSPADSRPVSSRSDRSAASEALSMARAQSIIELKLLGVPPAAAKVMVIENVTAAMARSMGPALMADMLSEAQVSLTGFAAAQFLMFLGASPADAPALPSTHASPTAAQLAAATTAAPPLSMPILPGREGAGALPESLAPPAGAGKATEVEVAVAAAANAAEAADAAAAHVARLRAAQRDGSGAQSEAASAPRIPSPPLELTEQQPRPVVSARGLECWVAVREVKGDLLELLREVPTHKVEATIKAVAGLFDATARLLSGEWDGESMVGLLGPQVTAAFRSVSSTAASALEAVTQNLEPSTRAILALSAVCASGNTAPRGGGYARGETACAGLSDPVRKAVERLGATSGGRDLVTKLEGLGVGSATDEAASSAFRQAVSAGELDPDFGPHLSMLLHQEKMSKAPSGERNLTSNASSVWASVVEVRARLGQARVRAYKHLLPKAVDALAFVTATNCCQLSLEVVCGAKKLPPGDARMAAARAWPVLIALSRECHPREAADLELGLLRVCNDAFDRADTAENMIKAVAPVFDKMAVLYDEYMKNGGTAPSWSAARKDTTLFDSEDARLDHFLTSPATHGKPFVASSSFTAGVDLGAGAGKTQPEQAATAAAATAKAATAAAARVQAAADKKAAEVAAAKAAK
jgi:hypothetical protein